MRSLALMIALVAATAHAQSVTSVYNRDTHEPFRLKEVHVDSTVVGPLVRTSTVLTYENPYKTLTEATLNFELGTAAALSGFAYFYGDEYVRGRLMDKAKAWFIYTAITSRNRDPGIMEQWSPTTYHCQIYPIKTGSDLKVRLYTVDFLRPSGDKLVLPKPQAPHAVGYAVEDGNLAKLNWNVRTVRSAPAVKVGDDYAVPIPEKPLTAVAQRFKDGRVYVAGIMHASGDSSEAPTFAALRQPKSVQLDSQTIAFMGWLPHNRKIAVRNNGMRAAAKPLLIHPGNEAARLWAQQMLATVPWRHGKDVLHFSLKYGVPSNATALLAVPDEEMKLFREKEKKWQEKQAEARRQQREQERRQRAWARSRSQNWSNSGGGDPEIRVTIPGAQSAKAFLPDGRVIDLTRDGDIWGGNFEIPAGVPEGTYEIRVIAKMGDGSTAERSWSYRVDRTPPTGTVRFLVEGGKLLLEVRSKPGLAEVAAFEPDGTKLVLKEVSPGLYRLEIVDRPAHFVVILKDKAGNKADITCSWSQ